MARQRAPRRLLLAAALVVSGPGIASAQASGPDSVVYRLLPISRFGNRLGPFDLTMIEIGEYDALGAQRRWWPALPWRTAAEAPAFSTGTAHLMR